MEKNPFHEDETSPTDECDNQRVDSEEDKANINLIGFEDLNLKANQSLDVMSKSATEFGNESMEKLDSPKLKPVPTEKPSPSTLERRKHPIAAPRSLTNPTTSQGQYLAFQMQL